MLSKMGSTNSREIGGSGLMFGRWCSPTRLRSICSIIMDPRSGSNPAPVMLTQLVNFNLLTKLTASMHVNTFSISSSLSFIASAFSIFPKSRVSQWLPTMAELLSLDETAEFPSKATANKTFDGAARKLAACANIPLGRSEMQLML